MSVYEYVYWDFFDKIYVVIPSSSINLSIKCICVMMHIKKQSHKENRSASDKPSGFCTSVSLGMVYKSYVLFSMLVVLWCSGRIEVSECNGMDGVIERRYRINDLFYTSGIGITDRGIGRG